MHPVCKTACRAAQAALVLIAFPVQNTFAQSAVPQRPVLEGIATDRLVYGAPYELAGRRIVFTNWRFVQPGDLDWRNAQGKSVYVSGDSGPFEAHSCAGIFLVGLVANCWNCRFSHGSVAAVLYVSFSVRNSIMRTLFSSFRSGDRSAPWRELTADAIHQQPLSRRGFLAKAAVLGGVAAALRQIDALADETAADHAGRAVVGAREPLKITKLETFIHRNSWVFVKITTDAGIVGWGEMLKDKSKACAAEAQEMAAYLVGKDPRPIAEHWQAIYRHGFYRGGPVLTSVLSGIDMALWDIKGKALGMPVHELLGGPTRKRIRVYGSRQDVLDGRCTAMKTLLSADDRAPYKYVENAGYIDRVARNFGNLREQLGPDVDIGVEFHGAVPPQTSLLLMKALEPYHPYFFEEPVQAQNLDVMAELAAKTHIPVATGERVYTKWGFREVLEKKAASILQPDVCYAGGITELRLIAGLAEAYYVPLAPHNPQGPCSLAASCQIAAAIPNFLIQERGTNTHENLLKTPFHAENGYLPTPTAPGLGIEIDEDKFLAEVGEPSPYRRTYDRDDGSVVDW